MIRLVIILLLFISTAAAAQQIRQDSTGTHGADNLKQKTDSIGRKIRTATSFKTSLPDSLNPLKKGQKKIAGVDAKVKSMSHVDSLFTFKPGLRQVDSLKLAYRQKAIALQNKAGKKKRKIKHSLDSLERDYQSKAKNATSKFMRDNPQLVSGHEKEILGKMNFNAPAVSSQFPNVNMPSVGNLNTPSLGLGNVSLPTGATPSLSQPTLNTSGVTLPSANIPNLPTGELTKETGELKSLEGQAGAYQKQLTQLKKDSAENAQKLEKEFEDKVQGRTEVKAIKDKQLEVEKMKKLQQQYMEKTAQYRNPQMIEKEIRQNSANIANSVLASQEKSVQAAQSKLAKAKKKYGEFESINHLPKRPVNPMKEVPFRERLFPGFCLQMTGGEFVSLDVAPQAYYKITTRLDAGAGFVYRVNYDFKKSTFVNNNNLYGFKLFTNVKVYKSFYVRAEYERINKQFPLTSDLSVSRWTNTLLGGIGKEFFISKKIQGTSMALYNALSAYNNPYPSKVVFRIGFNLSLKKDQRKAYIRSLERK